LFTRLALSALLDAVELMAPELFKGLYPVMHSFQLLRFQVVHALFALLDHGDHADLAQHAKVLRDSRLREPERYDQRSDSQGPAPRKQLDNLAPTGLGDGVEYVGCSRRTRHASIIFPYGNLSSQDSVTRSGDGWWDDGPCDLLEWSDERIGFIVHGGRLHGMYSLDSLSAKRPTGAA
jgi:hypothetical protein